MWTGCGFPSPGESQIDFLQQTLIIIRDRGLEKKCSIPFTFKEKRIDIAIALSGIFDLSSIQVDGVLSLRRLLGANHQKIKSTYWRANQFSWEGNPLGSLTASWVKALVRCSSKAREILLEDPRARDDSLQKRSLGGGMDSVFVFAADGTLKEQGYHL